VTVYWQPCQPLDTVYGARKDLLRWVTHGPEGDKVSLYTTLPWPALCDEVTKLRIELREGRLLEFRKVASVECYSSCYNRNEEIKKPQSLMDFTHLATASPTGFEPYFGN